MTYAETLEYMYAQLPMFTRIGAAAYKADLDNTIALCAAFGNPHKQFKSIHIAGTNGKGSTSHMLAAVFHASGYKTGLYTSPHLKDFRERIKVSAKHSNRLEMIDQPFVVDFIERAQPFIASIQPSFFELTMVMAFAYFAQQKVDIAIIETGLGGRLDSTNIITPELSIITNIGYDHMNILGNTLPEIAFEKAGIIKSNIPVVIGETLPETKPVFEAKAKEVNSLIVFAEEAYQFRNTNDKLRNEERCDDRLQFLEVGLFDNECKVATDFMVDLPGLYQQKNVRTVATAIKNLLPNWPLISDDSITNALKQVKQMTGLHGRWEIIETNPNVILDVGHNEDGIKQVLQQITAMLEDNKSMGIHIIIGMVKDKEVEKVLQLLSPSFKYYFTNAHLPRALPALDLKQIAATFNLMGNAYDNVNEAIGAAKSASQKEDTIIVCGSVFVVGEVDC